MLGFMNVLMILPTYPLIQPLKTPPEYLAKIRNCSLSISYKPVEKNPEFIKSIVIKVFLLTQLSFRSLVSQRL
jgi:hypothetical protein